MGRIIVAFAICVLIFIFLSIIGACIVAGETDDAMDDYWNEEKGGNTV